eukprot:m.26341 g.26341  ORF g.26341 m.26341 type:complete len:71 (+) comp29256_c0_seq1:442-654(+)
MPSATDGVADDQTLEIDRVGLSSEWAERIWTALDVDLDSIEYGRRQPTSHRTIQMKKLPCCIRVVAHVHY